MDELWGPETKKAVENFQVSGEPIPRHVARWLGRIKAAAARVNAELGLLDADKAERIASAADRIAAGELDDQFPIDVFQTGSGTSSNMNANEVIASLAGDGRPPERRREHGPVLERRLPVGRPPRRPRPADERPRCRRSTALAEALEAKAREFDDVVKSGRTHLMDAVPGHARPGVRGLRGPGSPGDRPHRVDVRAPRPDPARRHRRRHGPQHPPRVRRARAHQALRRDRVSPSSRRPILSRRRPRATGSSRRRRR